MLLVLSLFEIFGLCHLRLLIGYCILSPSLTVQAIVFRSLRDLKVREWGHNVSPSSNRDLHSSPAVQTPELPSSPFIKTDITWISSFVAPLCPGFGLNAFFLHWHANLIRKRYYSHFPNFPNVFQLSFFY
ncbi:hypothetical protein BGW80DRAFT_574909 [Lactifluus volemus]|nr:hypothetical protein BGW80DRAFT_574909 [Lactifluus volemus]